MRILLADRWHHGWLAACFAVALVWVGDAMTGVLAPLERAWAEQTQAAVAVRLSPDIVLVVIDDASLSTVGTWPWPREVHAQLIDRLTAADARLIVHTVPFVGAESQQALAQLQRIAQAVSTDPALVDHGQLLGLVQQSQTLLDADGQLAASLQQSKRTLLAVRGPHTASLEWPLAQLSSAAMGVGHVFFDAEPDGLVRAHALQASASGRMVPSLALWTVSAAQGLRPADLQQRDGWARLARLNWPVDRAGRVHPLWRPAARATFEHYPASAILAGQVAPSKLSGKLVLIGPTAAAVATALPLAGGSLMPVEALAQTSSALLTEQLVNQPRWSGLFTAGLTLLVLLYLAWCMPRLAVRSALALTMLIGVLLLSLSHGAMTQALMDLPVVLPLVALLCGHAAWQVARLRHSAPRAPSWQGSAPAALGQAPTGSAPLEPPAEPLPPAPPAPAAPAAPAALPEVDVLLRPVARPVLLSDLAPLDTRPAPYDEEILAYREPHLTRPAGLTQPAPLGLPVAVAATASRLHRLPQLGEFQLSHEIGRGAMGRVYQAQTVASGEAVAIKTLALAREFEGFALQEARVRFQREALAALRLRHPDIVQVIDAGEDQGYAWIAMELLQGHDLVRYTVPHNLLAVPEVLEICARIAGALSHAHAQGVVHRDIKPANVMYLPDSGAVKVTDFGIARITDAARTRTGLVLGSPSYMSPEHLAGGLVDGRSDLYSLGVLLFQLLTGALPVQGHSMAELMRAVAHTPAPDVRSLRPRLPEAVANIVSLALEKRVELRYADAREMETDLRLVRGLWERRAVPEPSHQTVHEVARPVPPPIRPAGHAEPLVHNQPG